jgi:hypothetical protein
MHLSNQFFQSLSDVSCTIPVCAYLFTQNNNIQLNALRWITAYFNLLPAERLVALRRIYTQNRKKTSIFYVQLQCFKFNFMPAA